MEIAALSAALPPILNAPATPPAQLATERFNAVMNAPEVDAPALTGLQAALQTAFAPPVDAAPQTLGNQILASLRSTTTEYSEKWQGISGRLDAMAAQPSVADMMRLQADLLHVSVNYEMVSKAVSRTTQNIDSLVRMS
ncbi:type III secretion system inner rod subunit SctI [Achromobacter deleyi]|uniref:type III secretion system inner rod subunit SctI n=1 Tax=Achromobacter deleyi TaxID=1353891 RepID=UPI001490B1B8|nr:type III secretion system inner rod subunit SctI [Achromobacter deleyi]QVQ24860.1 type III secretion system inner rod subunit SctI [Achromobacter deleyi]UIP20400.1 type III secretion system inner rod subunit SctI [Achromobacter deleyi]